MRAWRWLALILAMPLVAAGPAKFREHTISTELPGGYQVLPLDVNRDGRIDLVALASQMKELVWFENPTWERHVLATGMSRMINLAACSEDGEGYPVIVVAQRFENQAAKSVGEVLVLERSGDVRRPWRKKEIDRLPTSHRLRCADMDGSGQKVVINGPLTGAKAARPDYRDHVPLAYYRPGEWKRRLIGNQNEGVMHGIFVHDWNSDGRDDILTASFVGIHAFSFGEDGQWRRQEITKGHPAPWPESGASDLAVGHLGGQRFVASIEPWHGHQVVVYREGERLAIDDTLVNGHTVITADLNGDGRDEVVAGFRGEGQSVYVYYAEGSDWRRTLLGDGGMSAAACAAVDLNGDSRIDIACIGSATRNLKWYENVGNSSGPKTQTAP